MADIDSLNSVDPVIYSAIGKDIERQRLKINLIAAENYASRAVLEAMGTVLTNKYAEGYPGRRYYGGCQNVDEVESLAITRAKELFGAAHTNVQPHSGAQANMAAYFALLKPGDTVLAMHLAHGGHLTHGSSFNISGSLYNFVTYGVNRETEKIEYSVVEELADEHKPRLIIAGASSYPRVIDFGAFRQIADRVGAMLMVDMAHLAGQIAANLHPSPVPHADIVTSTTHKTLRGPRGGLILCTSELASKVDSSVFPGTQGGPLMHVIAAKAVAFHEAMQPDFKMYQRASLENAKALADELAKHGMRIVTGGTDNHIVLVDLSQMDISGVEAEKALEASGIIVNKNAIPFDTRPTRITSGIRLGTPAVTSRGFGLKEMELIAQLLVRVLTNIGDESVYGKINKQVIDACRKFPMPGL